MTGYRHLLGATAALALLAASVSAAQAQLEVSVSGNLNFSDGIGDLPASGRDFDFSADPDIEFRGVADNGLEYGARVEFGTRDGDPAEDETDVYLRGSWGSLDFGDNNRIPACDTPLAGLHGAVHYLFDVDNDRGVLSTEENNQPVVPGYTFENDLSGFGGLGFGTFCADIFKLPTYFTLGYDYSVLSGETDASNVDLPNGLGIPGVGVDLEPGVFINSPTILNNLSLSATRSTGTLYFQVDQPLFSNGRNINSADGSPPLFTTFSLIKGIRAGWLDQTERAEVQSTTAAFPDPNVTTVYDTHFRSSFAGFYLGGSLDATIPLSPRLDLLLSGSGTAGYDFHHVTVNDQVTATGLGGALNFASQNTIEYALGTPTGTLSASVGLSTGAFEVGFFGGVSVGKNPTIEYTRSDVDPTLSFLAFNPSFTGGVFVGGDF